MTQALKDTKSSLLNIFISQNSVLKTNPAIYQPSDLEKDIDIYQHLFSHL